MTQHHPRIFFIGDELISGLGDVRALGWTGRVLARTQLTPPIFPFTFVYPEADLYTISTHWETDVLPRLDPEGDNRLVLGVGSHDLDKGVSNVRSRLYLANIIDTAVKKNIQPLVVGPTPRRDVSPSTINALSTAYQEVCRRRAVPYVETFGPLVKHEQWTTDLALGNGYVPHQTGYGLIAWLVLNQGWYQWLGINPQ